MTREIFKTIWSNQQILHEQSIAISFWSKRKLESKKPSVVQTITSRTFTK